MACAYVVRMAAAILATASTSVANAAATAVECACFETAAVNRVCAALPVAAVNKVRVHYDGSAGDRSTK